MIVSENCAHAPLRLGICCYYLRRNIMRSKVLLVIAALFVFGLGVAVYALNSSQTTNTTVAAACCCCSGDSCPIKSKDAKATTTKAGHECCCKAGGESCPMKSKDAQSGDKIAVSADGKHSCPMMSGHTAHEMEPGMKHEMKMGDGESCPMMQDAKAQKMHKGMRRTADGKDGCGCACCSVKATLKNN